MSKNPTEPDFLSKQCPPCNGDCTQGKACNAYPKPDPLPEAVSDLEFVCWVGIAFLALCALGSCVFGSKV